MYCTEVSSQKSKYAYRKIFFYKKCTVQEYLRCILHTRNAVLEVTHCHTANQSAYRIGVKWIRPLVTRWQCYKDDIDSQLKKLKFDPRHPKTSEPVNRWLPKLVGVTTSRRLLSWLRLFPVQNCITIRLGDITPRIRKVIYENDHPVSFVLIFRVLPTRYPKAAPPILTTNTSKDVVSRKDLPFGRPENEILHFDSIFPKNANFRSIFGGLHQ